MSVQLKLIIIVILLVKIENKLSCLNHNSESVSYSLMFSFPNSAKVSKHYNYLDENSKQNNLQSESIDSKGQPLYNTLSQYNKQKSTYQLLAWNDENPNDEKTYNYGAHSKGLIILDESLQYAVYLTHSAPKYPQINEDEGIIINMDYQRSIYGQSFICLSLTIDQIENIAFSLHQAKIHVYYSSVNVDPRSYPNLDRISGLVKDKTTNNLVKSFLLLSQVTKEQTVFFQTLTISKLTNLKYFYKWPSTNIDIFQNIIMKTLDAGLYVESWGRPWTPSYCQNKKLFVKNIMSIKVDEDTSYLTTQDHSKWAVVDNQKTFCVGDINHMDSQSKRGGIFICFDSQVINTNMYELIYEYEECEKQTQRSYQQ